MVKDIAVTYTDSYDGSTLQIDASTNSEPRIKISLFRLTDMDGVIGEVSDGSFTFTSTNAARNPIKGSITIDGDKATLVFTESTWEYLPNGSTYHFKRDTQAMIQERSSWWAKPIPAAVMVAVWQ